MYLLNETWWNYSGYGSSGMLFNQTDLDLAELGEGNYGPEVVALLSSALLLEIIIGLSCNLAVLVVYHLNRRTMKTVSNLIITNLNVMDTLFCITSIPVTLSLILTARNKGGQEPLLCYLHEATVSFASCGSAINLLFISLDRYQTIITPLTRRFTIQNVRYVIGAIWALALTGLISPLLSVDIGALTQEHFMFINNSNLPCNLWIEIARHNYYYELYYVVLYVISNSVMLFCYTRIFRAARNRLSIRTALIKATLFNIPGARNADHNAKMQERRVTKMTLSIVSTFMICWGPHAATTVVVITTRPTFTLDVMQMCFLTLAYMSTALHPLLYAFMRKNFRSAFKGKLKRRNSKKGSKINPESSVNRRSPGHQSRVNVHKGSFDVTESCSPTQSTPMQMELSDMRDIREAASECSAHVQELLCPCNGNEKKFLDYNPNFLRLPQPDVNILNEKLRPPLPTTLTFTFNAPLIQISSPSETS